MNGNILLCLVEDLNELAAIFSEPFTRLKLKTVVKKFKVVCLLIRNFYSNNCYGLNWLHSVAYLDLYACINLNLYLLR